MPLRGTMYNPARYTDGQNPYAAAGTGQGTVAGNVTGLLARESPYMQQATTAGMRAANRRGLANSSMAVGAAEGARIAAAMPIAAQDSAQADTQYRAAQTLAAHDREKAASMATAMGNSYSEMFRTIATQGDIPADQRDRYLRHAIALRDDNMRLVQQMYNVGLSWTTPWV